MDPGVLVNVVFIGASKFGLQCLESCLSLPQIQVVGVVTAPETFSIYYRPAGVRNVLYADINSFAKDHSLRLASLKFDERDWPTRDCKEWSQICSLWRAGII